MRTSRRLYPFFGAAILGLLLLHPASAAAPSNDPFSRARAVSALPYTNTGDTTDATLERAEPSRCDRSLIDNTVWYQFTPARTATVSADTAGSDFDTVLSVFTGAAVGGLTPVVCSDDVDFVDGDPDSRVHFLATAGVTYRVQLGGWQGAHGSFTFHLSEVLPPANDNFAAATDISHLRFSAGANTTGATIEKGEPVPSCADASPVGNTVWYRFVPQSTSLLVANTFSSDFDTVLAVYTGSSLDALTGVMLGCSNDFLTVESQTVFLATAGTAYYIQIGGVGGEVGNLTFTLREVTG